MALNEYAFKLPEDLATVVRNGKEFEEFKLMAKRDRPWETTWHYRPERYPCIVLLSGTSNSGLGDVRHLAFIYDFWKV